MSRWGSDQRDSWYDTAQVCENGHVSNSYAQQYPEHNKKFCPDCGKPTLTECSGCNAAIRGEYHVLGVVMVSHFTPPAFCHECGTPFPWTEQRIRTAQELAEEADNLDDKEKEALKQTFSDLTHDSPRTPLAVSTYKRLARKAGDAIGEGLKTILVEVACEAAKRQLWPGS